MPIKRPSALSGHVASFAFKGLEVGAAPAALLAHKVSEKVSSPRIQSAVNHSLLPVAVIGAGAGALVGGVLDLGVSVFNGIEKATTGH